MAIPVPWLAIDDTDTRMGGCTTWTAWRIAAAIEAGGGPLQDWRCLGRPRLVRLCPAIRERTRGNGAVVLEIGPGTSERRTGFPDDGQADMPEANAPEILSDAVVGALRRLVSEWLPAAGRGAADPQPAIVVGTGRPHHGLYVAAVAARITRDRAWRHAAANTIALTPPGRRGEIGALAAAAWPARRFTFEAMMYRAVDQSGTGPRSRGNMEDALPPMAKVSGGFDNMAHDTGRVRAVPRTPCPVLAAVRGTSSSALDGWLSQALARLGDSKDTRCRAEGGWVMQTNQATGDHARFARRSLGPERCVRLRVVVAAGARRIRGGHAFLDCRVDGGPQEGAPVVLAAFEPTKDLRGSMDGLARGDGLHVFGRIGAAKDRDPSRPWTVALEGFYVTHRRPAGLLPRKCVRCGGSTESMGQGQPRRCRRCRERAAPPELVAGGDAADTRDEGSDPRWVQVPDHVRGHLLPPIGGLCVAQAPQGGEARLSEPIIDAGEVLDTLGAPYDRANETSQGARLLTR